MTDNQSDKLDLIIQKLDKIINTISVVTVSNPNPKLDQIIQKLEPIGEKVQEIYQKLEAKEQAKTLLAPPLTPPTQT